MTRSPGQRPLWAATTGPAGQTVASCSSQSLDGSLGRSVPAPRRPGRPRTRSARAGRPHPAAGGGDIVRRRLRVEDVAGRCLEELESRGVEPHAAGGPAGRAAAQREAPVKVAAEVTCSSRCPGRTPRTCRAGHRRSRRHARGSSMTSPVEKSSCEPSLKTTRSTPAVTSATWGSSHRSVPARPGDAGPSRARGERDLGDGHAVQLRGLLGDRARGYQPAHRPGGPFAWLGCKRT